MYLKDYTVKFLIWNAPNPNLKWFSSRLTLALPNPLKPGVSQEWRCSWSSADRRCCNYIWVINNFIVYWGATYIRGSTVIVKCWAKITMVDGTSMVSSWNGSTFGITGLLWGQSTGNLIETSDAELWCFLKLVWISYWKSRVAGDLSSDDTHITSPKWVIGFRPTRLPVNIPIFVTKSVL